jgi:4,5-dihydroxyphthalate decarboxylase
MNRRTFLETTGGLAAVGLARPSKASAVSAPTGLPSVTVACSDYVRFMPLATGDYRPQDLDLTWVRGDRSEMLRRAASDPSVSGGEASMLQHLVRIDRKDRSLVGVPVFLLRNFTARDIYVKKGAAISPSGLNGRRVGIYSWAASGAVWYRHFLRYLKQEPASMKWMVGGTDVAAKVESVAPLPPHVELAPGGKSLTDLLLAGDIDALFAPIPPKKYHAVNGPIARLIPDFPNVEKRYFTDTRCYPPQHLLVLRKEVWENDRSVGTRLVAALDECETRFQASQHLFPYSSPWLIADVEESDLVMGTDYFAHGLEKNRSAIDVFCQSAFEDGLTQRRVTVDEYFWEFLSASG